MTVFNLAITYRARAADVVAIYASVGDEYAVGISGKAKEEVGILKPFGLLAKRKIVQIDKSTFQPVAPQHSSIVCEEGG